MFSISSNGLVVVGMLVLWNRDCLETAEHHLLHMVLCWRRFTSLHVKKVPMCSRPKPHRSFLVPDRLP